MIAAVQNVRILLRNLEAPLRGAGVAAHSVAYPIQHICARAVSLLSKCSRFVQRCVETHLAGTESCQSW